MKFGAGLPTGMEGIIYPVPFFDPDEFVAMAVLAEELGYDSVWGNDHYAPQQYVSTDAPPNFYEPLTILSAVAAATSTIELGTAVLVLPMRDVVTVAKQAMTLDQISRGRLLLGVGIGAYREEYEAARPDRFGANRGEILVEGLDLLRRLSTEDEVTHHDRWFATNALRMYPKAVHRPLRVLVGGHNQRAIDRAVRYGAGWIPGWRPFDELTEWIALLRERAADAGRDPASLIVAPQLSCLVGRTSQDARERYSQSGMVAHRKSLAYTGRDPRLAMDNNLVGSPQEVLDKVALLGDSGADHLACITFCVQSVAEYKEQLQWFAEEIIRPYQTGQAASGEGSTPPSRGHQ
jgi:probable F420-dependent oxidoreductase